MTTIMVEFVKYDTEKTQKRKRSKLLVESKTEGSVIKKLEQIHKGDKITVIHEITWGEEVAAKVKPKLGTTFRGEVKFYDEEKGFGFIHPDGDFDDLFFHSSALSGVVVYEKDLVEFEESEGPKGVIAIRIKVLDADRIED
jgi:CspA family cold shock protein